MKKKWPLALVIIMSTLFLGCDVHIDKGIDTEKKVEIDKKQEPPIINIINQIKPDKTQEKLPDSPPEKTIEDIAFDFLFEKMNHKKIFEMVCLMSSINSTPSQCKKDHKNCLNRVNKNSDYTIKLAVSQDEENIKSLMKFSNASQEEYLATLSVINKAVNSFSRLTCDSSDQQIRITKQVFTQLATNFFLGQNDKINKMKLIAEILMERALELGFFGRNHTSIRRGLLQ